MPTFILPALHTTATHAAISNDAEKYLSAAQTIQTKSLDPDKKCCYPSKPCENPRVVKSNGELHRFCHKHRARANLNQRRLEERRREQLQQQQQHQQQTRAQHTSVQQAPMARPMSMPMPIEAYMAQLDEQYGISDEQIQRFDLASTQQPSDLLVRLDLDEDDLRVLAAVLSVSDEDNRDWSLQ